jgi:hypothetical protein
MFSMVLVWLPVKRMRVMALWEFFSLEPRYRKFFRVSG